jgi:hypothetical protein
MPAAPTLPAGPGSGAAWLMPAPSPPGMNAGPGRGAGGLMMPGCGGGPLMMPGCGGGPLMMPGCGAGGLIMPGCGAPTDDPSPDAGLVSGVAGLGEEPGAEPAPGLDPDAAGCRAEGTPEPLTTGGPTGPLGLAAEAASAASGPVGAPLAGPDPGAPAGERSAAGDAASAGFWPEALPSEPSPGAHEGACTRLSTPSSSAPLSDTRLSPVSTA